MLVAGGRPLGRRAFVVAGVAPLVGLAWAAAQYADVADGQVPTEQLTWVPELGLSIDLRLNGFSLLMFLLVTGIGVLVQWYAGSYFAADRAGLHRLVAVVSGASMAGTARLLLGAFRPGVPTEGRVIEGPPPIEAPPAPAVSFWVAPLIATATGIGRMWSWTIWPTTTSSDQPLDT